MQDFFIKKKIIYSQNQTVRLSLRGSRLWENLSAQRGLLQCTFSAHDYNFIVKSRAEIDYL